MPVTTRSEATIANVLSAAAYLFISRHYADVTMDQIAETAHVTKGALYHHFSGKEELYLEMMHADLSAKKDLGVDLGIFGSSSSSGKQDVNIVQEFLLSQDMLKKVNSKFGLEQYYHSAKTDILERLYNYSTEEDFLALYRKNLHILHDDLAGITRIAFKINNPQLAKQILEFLLKEGEAFINQLNRLRAEKKIAFAASQLSMNKSKLEQGIAHMENFQNQHRLVDPSADVAVQNNIIANIHFKKLNRIHIDLTQLFFQLIVLYQHSD